MWVIPRLALKINHSFRTNIIDQTVLLHHSYRLRYNVYCIERRFLEAKTYPEAMETDPFDKYSIHFGALDREGNLAGAVRLVRPSAIGLPMWDACEIFPNELEQLRKISCAEVSRLTISRTYRRRSEDGLYGTGNTKDFENIARNSTDNERRQGPPLVLSLYIAVYQTAKRNGVTHLLAATEKSLQRLFRLYYFPFRPIGPEVDYFGPVTPYIMDLNELDHELERHDPLLLADFLDGLEPEFCQRT